LIDSCKKCIPEKEMVWHHGGQAKWIMVALQGPVEVGNFESRVNGIRDKIDHRSESSMLINWSDNR
jgi:hypothetical protein